MIFLSCFFSYFVHSQDTLILQPGPEGKDAMIYELLPNNNYANDISFKCMAWTHSGEPGICRALIDFNLSFLAPGSSILDAKLSLYFATYEPSYVTHTGENESYLLLTTESWQEDEVNWNNQPATTMENAVILPQSTDPEQDYPDIDITAQIQAIVSNPENYTGLMLRLINENYYRSMMFGSGDCPSPELHPKLEIIYIGCTVPSVDFEFETSGQTVSFSGISPSATVWHWDFGDGNTSDLQNPVHIYEQAGFYNVCLYVEDTCYHAEYCEMIEICLEAPTAGFTFTNQNLDAFFQNETDLAGTFYWDFGDGYFSDLENPWHNYQQSGEYLVCLTATNSCGTDSFCETVEICSPPVSGFNFTFDDLTAYFENQSQMADEYYWDFGDGYYSNLPDPVHIYDEPDNYQICLTTYNECGSDTICRMINLSMVTIDETGTNEFHVYPNPARDFIYINAALTGYATISLTDMSGKDMVREEISFQNNHAVKIMVSGVADGLYLLGIESPDYHYYKKIMITR